MESTDPFVTEEHKTMSRAELHSNAYVYVGSIFSSIPALA